METSQNGAEPGASVVMRWSRDLSDGEKASTTARTKIAAQCLGRHSIVCDQDQVPHVALLGSGGGLRAMISLMGTLTELGSEDLLDCITYLCGVSGSTWCMSSVYEDQDWSKNVKECENKICDLLNGPNNTQQSMWEKVKNAIEDGAYSLTILWSYLVGNRMLKKINEKSLSNHKDACENGANPYPIYAAVEKSNIVADKKNATGTWFEFTPHDAGFTDLGAFVNTEVIGSQFAKGDLASMKAQQTICYLQGLWGSALANEQEIKAYIKDYILSWFRGEPEVEAMPSDIMGAPMMRMEAYSMPEKCSCECCVAAEYLMTLSVDELESEEGKEALLRLEKLLEECEKNGGEHIPPPTPELEARAMQDLPGVAYGFVPSIISSAYEKTVMIAKLMKCLISWQWGTTHNYLYKCSTEDTQIPKELAEKEYIHLIDAGLAINSAYPLVLRPERKVNLILSFDYSAGDPFETLKRTSEYCKENKIPFPDIKVSKKEEHEPSGCYIFKGPNTPTVMHFPLFNKDNCADEIQKYRDTFSTFQTSYGEQNVNDLLRVSKLNVQKHKTKILQELTDAVHASQKQSG